MVDVNVAHVMRLLTQFGRAVSVGFLVAALVSCDSQERSASQHSVPPAASPQTSAPPSVKPSSSTQKPAVRALRLSSSIPRDARFLVAKTAGHGDSRTFHFQPHSSNYTVTLNCRGHGESLTVLGVDRVDIKCTKVPNNRSVGGTTGPQSVKLIAPDRVAWVLAVYEGLPKGVNVDSDDGDL